MACALGGSVRWSRYVKYSHINRGFGCGSGMGMLEKVRYGDDRVDRVLMFGQSWSDQAPFIHRSNARGREGDGCGANK